MSTTGTDRTSTDPYAKERAEYRAWCASRRVGNTGSIARFRSIYRESYAMTPDRTFRLYARALRAVRRKSATKYDRYNSRARSIARLSGDSDRRVVRRIEDNADIPRDSSGAIVTYGAYGALLFWCYEDIYNAVRSSDPFLLCGDCYAARVAALDAAIVFAIESGEMYEDDTRCESCDRQLAAYYDEDEDTDAIGA